MFGDSEKDLCATLSEMHRRARANATTIKSKPSGNSKSGFSRTAGLIATMRHDWPSG